MFLISLDSLLKLCLMLYFKIVFIFLGVLVLVYLFISTMDGDFGRIILGICCLFRKGLDTDLAKDFLLLLFDKSLLKFNGVFLAND
jgi:hypothetical protein